MKKFTLLMAAVVAVSFALGQTLQSSNEIKKERLNNDLKNQKTEVDVIGYCSDVLATNIGFQQEAELTGVIYFPGSTMSTYSGNEISDISIAVNPGNLVADEPVTIKIWTDTSGNGASPDYTQDIAYADLVDGWQEVSLNTPYSIDGSELFIGYTCQSLDYGMYMDDQTPESNGYGDLIYSPLLGSWNNVSALGIEANWSIKATVDDGVVLADDAGLNSIEVPQPQCGLTASEDVTVEIENFGSNDITGDLDIGYTINGGAEQTATYSDGLTAGSSTYFTFTMDMSAQETYEIEAYTKLSGDELDSNDTVSTATMHVAPISSYPYETTFDQDTYDFLGWTFEDVNDDDNTWFPAAGGGENIGSDDDYALVYQWNSAAAADDWAYTSCMDLAAGTYILTFKYNTAGGTDFPEKFEVFWGDDNTASAMTDELVPEMEVTNETYETEEVTFEVTTGGIYYIGFHCVSEADMWSLLIDEVSINEYTDVTENVDNKINVFPNPANNVVNIENAENADISILNMLGQEVVSQAANSSRESINISDLSNGTYIIRIEDGNEVITQKLNVVK